MSSFRNDAWVDQVRDATDLVELVGERVMLKRQGRNLVGLCPFHQDKSPSFSVSPDKGLYHCFSCKAGGDVFKYVMETEKIGFLEAAEWLSRRAGIPIPERRAAETSTRAPLLEALDAAATAYEQWLADPSSGAVARAYLESRGISREIQREFRLGVSLDGWEHLMGRLKGRFRDEVLLEARLAGRRERGTGLFDWFRNRLMVPLIDRGGSVVGFGARAFGDEKPKYLNSPESAVYHKSSFLFGLSQARRHIDPDGEVVVVEGYFDAIALHQAGIRNAVATSGTALTDQHARALRQQAKGVALTFDGDKAGQDAMLRGIAVLLAAGLDVALVDLPPGEDPDTVVRGAGAAGWSRLRDSALDPMEYVQRHVLRSGGVGDPRQRALEAIVPMLAGVQEAIRLRLLVERAAQVFGIPEQVIERAVRERGARSRGGAVEPPGAEASPVEVRTPIPVLERSLLQGLLAEPGLLDEVLEWVVPEDLRHPTTTGLLRWMQEHGAETPPGEGAEAAFAREALVSMQDGMDWTSEVRGAVKAIALRILEDRRRDVTTRLKSAQGEQQLQLMRELDEIGKRLKAL